MGLLKDWKEDSEGYIFKSRLVALFSPKVWLRLYKWRKQRADRGWSDRDTWEAGDHIAKMTAEMLQHLKDKSHVDWPGWFKYNIEEKGKDSYKSLQPIIDDINAYLEHQKKTWGDDLEVRGNLFDESFKLQTNWYYKNGRKLSEQQVYARIKKYADENIKLYKKATKAMQFFGRNFSGFWD